MRKTNKEESPIKISINTGTILRVVAFILAAILIYVLRDILIILIVALLVATVIDPFADLVQKHKLPRGVAVIISYFLVTVVMAGALVLIVPSVYEQSQNLFDEYSPVIDGLLGDKINLGTFSSIDILNQDAVSIVKTLRQSGAGDAFAQLFTAISGIFGGLLAVILVLILGYYMTVEEHALRSGLELITPKKHEDFIDAFLKEGRRKVGFWLRGQLLLMLIIGLLYYAVLTILGVPFALVLAVLGGLLEIVPYLGPNLAALPAVLIAFSISPALAVLVVVSYFLIQQLEADILTPKIMQKVTGVNPIVSIVGIMVGYQIAGVIGALLAIPLAVLGTVFVSQWISFYKK